MNRTLLATAFAALSSGAFAQVPAAAIDQYNAMDEMLSERTFEMTMVINNKDEATTMVIRKEAGQVAQLISENGAPPSEDALDDFEPERIFGGGGNGFVLALPESGYELMSEQGNIKRYRFQPLLLNKGKEDRASRYFSGELDLNVDCNCLTRVQMQNDDSFRKLGFKIEDLQDVRVFTEDDWRPTTFTSVFKGGALGFSVGATTEMTFNYQ